MANERERAQRIQSDFQKLLTELKNQDEQIAELEKRSGTKLADLPEPPGADAMVAAFDDIVADKRAELLRERDTPKLSGLVLRA